MNLAKNIAKIATTTTAAAALLVSTGGAAYAESPSISVTPESAQAVTSQADVGGRWCSGSEFGWNDFPSFKSWLDQNYALNSNNVWQAPNDDAVWDVWCHVTDGQAQLTDNGGAISVTPNVVNLGDGTRVGFRPTSKSGGYTIDINNNGTIYKVHRI